MPPGLVGELESTAKSALGEYIIACDLPVNGTHCMTHAVSELDICTEPVISVDFRRRRICPYPGKFVDTKRCGIKGFVVSRERWDKYSERVPRGKQDLRSRYNIDNIRRCVLLCNKHLLSHPSNPGLFTNRVCP